MKGILALLAASMMLAAGFALSQPKARKPPLSEISASQLISMIRSDTGKVVMLNIWATWCDACKEEMPDVAELRRNYAGDTFDLFLVSADDKDDKSKILPTLDSLGVDFETYLRSDSTDEAFISAISPQWSGAMPTTLLYDKHGRLTETIIGARTYLQYEKRLKKLLSDP